MTDKSDIEWQLRRLNSLFEDELGDNFSIEYHSWENIHRLKVCPDFEKTGESWESDLGPAFQTLEELDAFCDGLYYAKIGDVDAKAHLLND